jgi:hypothetical protein
MAEWFVSETFFRPPELSRATWNLPAGIFNPCQRLLARSRAGCVFVPIRAMQFQAVVDRDEILFVDSQGGYATQDGAGGRLIVAAWRPVMGQARMALHESVSGVLMHYRVHHKEFVWRLGSEFGTALRVCEQRLHDREMPLRGAKVVALRPGTI